MPLLPSTLFPKLKLQFTLHRLFSFYVLLDSSEDLPFDAEKLARKGFYCFEHSTIRCHFCNITLPINNDLEANVERDHPECRHESFKSNGNIPLPTNPNLDYEACRLYTALKRPWQFFSPLDLASNGFYYTGERDKCKCHFCFLEVEGWTEGDTPKNQHIFFNNSCPFLRDEANVPNAKIGVEQAGCTHDAIGQEHQGSKQMTESEVKEALDKTK